MRKTSLHTRLLLELEDNKIDYGWATKDVLRLCKLNPEITPFALDSFSRLCPFRLAAGTGPKALPQQQAAVAPPVQPASCPFNGTWRVQVEASCTRFRSTAIVENCKIVRGGHLRGASGSIDPSTGAVTYRVAASSDEGTPGGSGVGTLRRDQSGSGRINLGPGCEGSMRWWRE
jgi:hypothetical protein